MAKIGRPSKRTAELEDALVAHVAEAKTIRAFCRDKGISSSTVYGWMGENLDLSERVARARKIGAFVLEDEIQDIADTPTDHRDDVQHRKLRVYAREKRLAWNDPGRYGQKVQLGGAVGLPPVKFTDDERADRIKQLLDKATSRNGKQPSPSATTRRE